MPPPGDTYRTEKWWAILIVLVLAVICSGFLTPFAAKFQVRQLKRRERSADDAERERLRARLTEAEARADKSWLSLVLGEDGRLSTSKTIAWLWTVIVAYILVALILVWPENWTAALKNLAPTYLLLLGGPYAAFVFAKGVVSVKVERGTLQKPKGDGTPRLSDLVGNDAGRTDLNDSQYVLFNLIAMGFVVDAFWRATTGGFPDIPAGLVLLTGGPAAVYAATKTITSNAPVIFSVFPSTVRPGQSFTIYGQNLGPASATERPKVEVDGTEAVLAGEPTDTSIAALAPVITATGRSRVSVVTPAGPTAVKNDALEILTTPKLTGLSKAVAAPGDRVTATGVWSEDPTVGLVVLVDGLVATIADRPAPGRTIEFIVPEVAPPLPREVDVQVVIDGLASEARKLQVVAA